MIRHSISVSCGFYITQNFQGPHKGLQEAVTSKSCFFTPNMVTKLHTHSWQRENMQEPTWVLLHNQMDQYTSGVAVQPNSFCYLPPIFIFSSLYPPTQYSTFLPSSSQGKAFSRKTCPCSRYKVIIPVSQFQNRVQH